MDRNALAWEHWLVASWQWETVSEDPTATLTEVEFARLWAERMYREWKESTKGAES